MRASHAPRQRLAAVAAVHLAAQRLAVRDVRGPCAEVGTGPCAGCARATRGGVRGSRAGVCAGQARECARARHGGWRWPRAEVRGLCAKVGAGHARKCAGALREGARGPRAECARAMRGSARASAEVRGPRAKCAQPQRGGLRTLTRGGAHPEVVVRTRKAISGVAAGRSTRERTGHENDRRAAPNHPVARRSLMHGDFRVVEYAPSGGPLGRQLRCFKRSGPDEDVCHGRTAYRDVQSRKLR